jgi:uncharacterized protein YceH (UPF0502 family)
VLCELMLRGPQTIGQLRNRAGRLHAFASLAEVEETVRGLTEKEDGALVVRLAREPGRRESRYGHVLCGAQPAAEETDAPRPAVSEPRPARPADRVAAVESAVGLLREELHALRREVEALKARSST